MSKYARGAYGYSTGAMKSGYSKSGYSKRRTAYRRPVYSKYGGGSKVAVMREKREAAREKREATKEPGVISSIGGELGSLAGGIVPVVGGPIGRFLGGKLGHLVEKITGFGDYKVQSNSILKGGVTVPQIVNSVNRGSVIVRHREYLGEVASTTAFTITKYTINPGLTATFPWLSQIANSYEQYALRGVLFEYNSTSSDAVLSTATSSSLGTVMMATDYDIADPTPANKREMMTNEYSCSAKPSLGFIHPIECKRSLTPNNILYTRGAAVPAGYDARLYDFANFYIATEGMQGIVGNVGELWVTYEVELFKPQYNSIELTESTVMNTITSARPFGTVAFPGTARGATINGAYSGNGLSYSFPPNYSSGQFLMVYQVNGASAVVTSIPPPTLVNITPINIFSSSLGAPVSQMQSPQTGATTTTLSFMFAFKITGPNASITLSNAIGWPGTSNWGSCNITKLPDTLMPL